MSMIPFLSTSPPPTAKLLSVWWFCIWFWVWFFNISHNLENPDLWFGLGKRCLLVYPDTALIQTKEKRPKNQFQLLSNATISFFFSLCPFLGWFSNLHFYFYDFYYLIYEIHLNLFSFFFQPLFFFIISFQSFQYSPHSILLMFHSCFPLFSMFPVSLN